MFSAIRTQSSPRAALFSVLLVFLAQTVTTDVALAQEGLVGWGRSVVDSRWHQEPFAEVAAGGSHAIALRSNGSAVAWGANNYGQCNVPALPPGLTYVEVAAGGGHTVARRGSGSVGAWGDNT